MVALKQAALFAVFGLLATTSSVALGQLYESESEESLDSHFTVTTSVGLSFRGLQSSTEFRLVDDIGFEYDVMSLLRHDSVKKIADINESQYEELKDAWEFETQQLKSQVVKSVISEQNKDHLKEMFLDAQANVLKLMRPDQVQRLEQAKHQVAIEQYGIANYVASQRMQKELELTTDQLESLDESEATFKSSYETKARELLTESNRLLLNKLTQSQRKSFDALMLDDDVSSFLETKLFIGKKSAVGIEVGNRVTLLGITTNRNTRSRCKIDDDQYRSIKGLRRIARKATDDEIENKLSEILHPDQIEELKAIAINVQVSKLGTVKALSYGLLGREFELSTEESQRLFEFGQQIESELAEALTNANAEAVQNSMQALSPEQCEKLVDIIGQIDPLKPIR